MNNDQKKLILRELRRAFNDEPGPASARLTELAGRLDDLLMPKPGPAPRQPVTAQH